MTKYNHDDVTNDNNIKITYIHLGNLGGGNEGTYILHFTTLGSLIGWLQNFNSQFV
jgi:hypothetical protein